MTIIRNIRSGMISELFKKTNNILTTFSPSASTDYSGRGQGCSGRELLCLRRKTFKYLNDKTNYNLGIRGKFWIF